MYMYNLRMPVRRSGQGRVGILASQRLKINGGKMKTNKKENGV